MQSTEERIVEFATVTEEAVVLAVDYGLLFFCAFILIAVGTDGNLIEVVPIFEIAFVILFLITVRDLLSWKARRLNGCDFLKRSPKK